MQDNIQSIMNEIRKNDIKINTEEPGAALLKEVALQNQVQDILRMKIENPAEYYRKITGLDKKISSRKTKRKKGVRSK